MSGAEPRGGDPAVLSVWLVEDHAAYREVLQRTIDDAAGLQCTAAAASGEEAIAALSSAPLPDVVLMDLELPDLDGAGATLAILARCPEALVIALTAHRDDKRIVDVLGAGAVGYLLKSASEREILDGILSAVSGGSPIDAFVARRLLQLFGDRLPDGADGPRLTSRELEILDLFANGSSQIDVAGTLFLSRHTIDSHVRNIYAKLGVRTQAAAVARAIRRGLI